MTKTRRAGFSKKRRRGGRLYPYMTRRRGGKRSGGKRRGGKRRSRRRRK